MTPQDIFALVTRIAGLLVVLHAALNGLPRVFHSFGTFTYFIFLLAVGFYLLRAADRVAEFTYSTPYGPRDDPM